MYVYLYTIPERQTNYQKFFWSLINYCGIKIGYLKKKDASSIGISYLGN